MYLGLGGEISQPSSLVHCFSPCVVVASSQKLRSGFARVSHVHVLSRGGGGG